MARENNRIDTVRASRAGHSFHERWAARRILQLVFPKDNLYAVAVEGISTNETSSLGRAAEEVADLVLYYGEGDTFSSCDRLETIQFKYQVIAAPVTSSYLKKTVEKFAETLKNYEKDNAVAEVDAKVSFSFVTNTDFAEPLWKAIEALKAGVDNLGGDAGQQFGFLDAWCREKGVDPYRLFAMTDFRASERNLPALSGALKRTLTDWSAGSDSAARMRLHDLKELVIGKAGPAGQTNNLIKQEDVLDALGCEPEDLFPADTRFIPVSEIVERDQLTTAVKLLKNTSLPLVVHADGGVGKTVFIQSLASALGSDFEVVMFDCFGGGSYRSEDQARHLPKVGLVQIINELASRGACDPLLPGDGDRIALIEAARKRLSQAAAAIVQQSDKRGLLIILDAADNAQLEADNRKEDAFPKLLLASLDREPIEGLKLVLTARSHRMADVIGQSRAMELELSPFTEDEARSFLSTRRQNLSDLEFATAMARSKGNARVLAYLLESWDRNVLGSTSDGSEIAVEEIIAQSCESIFKQLRVIGWSEGEIREFFAGISLLPPPIPLDELANALGWSFSQVKSAASDLAPMLEDSVHGAIFRDEPTETYIRETYSGAVDAQQAIAQRLQDSQNSSAYAAEALPHFLVVINDSDRAFALAESGDFPKAIHSDFGKRRLTLARLYAAFRLAVKAGDLDRVLKLTMRLSQVASANAKGDQFIRRSPGLAVMLGDRDAYRRLFNDRSGWRGARSARLAVAHCLAGEMDEAAIQSSRTTGWINWNAQQVSDEDRYNREGPESSDFAAVIFENAVGGQFEVVDHNLVRWNRRFALTVSAEVLNLVQLYDRYNNSDELKALARFAASRQSRSFALKIALLSANTNLNSAALASIARSVAAIPGADDGAGDGNHFDHERRFETDIVRAALAALLYGSRASARRIMAAIPPIRPSSYDYSERHGPSRAWTPVFCACMNAWAAGRRVQRHDLLPREVKIARRAKAIDSKEALLEFLKKLEAPRRADQARKKRGSKPGLLFKERECREIAAGIELILALIKPVEKAILEVKGVSDQCLEAFISVWQSNLRTGIHWSAEEAKDQLSRTIGLGIARLLLRHALEISPSQAARLIELVSTERFAVGQKTGVLGLLARRSALSDLAGRFARHITAQIKSDDYIEQRGESYADLAAALVPMSLEEAREYYRLGLAELDQMGGNDFDQIYSLLHYAAQQRGGLVRAELGHRLMNLCQTIAHHEPSKFGWTLFGRAAANSIGLTALNKLIRWDDQDIANFSYGVPQLACYLAKNGTLDPRRAAFLLTICEDHGWHDWRVGDGLADLLELAEPADQRAIFTTVFEKLKVEHAEGGWPSVWESLLKVGDKFPGLLTDEEQQKLADLNAESVRKRDEYNSRSISGGSSFTDVTQKDENPSAALSHLVAGCEAISPVAIDEAIRAIREQSLPYPARHDFFAQLRAKCTHDQRMGFLLAVCESSELEFDDAVDLIISSVEEWADSTVHLKARSKELIEHLFQVKGSELFDVRYSALTRYIQRLSEFCGDQMFIFSRVLETIAQEQLELDGDEWLQLATCLCDQATPEASLEALETLLLGPALRIADDIGEGPFRDGFLIDSDQPQLMAGIIWHLLGDYDGYMRWKVGRGIKTLCDLGLLGDLQVLIDGFDRTQIDALVSEDTKLSFQNSQQWLLMGLSRAALFVGPKLTFLRPQLTTLVKRSDVHVVNKIHLMRCIDKIYGESPSDIELNAIRSSITAPLQGYVETVKRLGYAEARSGFSFDYEFNKTEVTQLAWIFGLSQGEAVDAVADEIKKRWPEATSLRYFPGRDRYRRGSDDRYEFYREHVQRHALISAATSLARTHPVVVRSYEMDDDSTRWTNWLADYDITFGDGSWLTDRKDAMPSVAQQSLLGPRNGKQDTLQSQVSLLTKIGLANMSSDALVPIHGHWTSPDGVYVTIVSALAASRGSIGECENFAKRSNHDLWLPQFWDGGYYSHRYRNKSSFEPFVWSPETYGVGIDVGDELAIRGAAARPRLGIELTESLRLSPDQYSAEWRTPEDQLVLKSLVWGKWKPTEDNHRHHALEEGEMLFAEPRWLDMSLSKIGKKLVYLIKFSKYSMNLERDERTGAKSVYVALRVKGSELRVWHAKKASLEN